MTDGDLGMLSYFELRQTTLMFYVLVFPVTLNNYLYTIYAKYVRSKNFVTTESAISLNYQ